jgi:hypothetical protein
MSRFVNIVLEDGIWAIYTTMYASSNRKLGVFAMHQIYVFCYFVLGVNITT